jgi:hypothetical protein
LEPTSSTCIHPPTAALSAPPVWQTSAAWPVSASKLHRGVFVNLGSAVIIPEVFLKALNLARNVGNQVGELVTLDMDFMRHYRPR